MDFFASNAEYLRKSRGLKQSEIQSAIGIEQTRWSNYEKGKSRPNLELFHTITKYFDVNADDLLNKDLSNNNTNVLISKKDDAQFSGQNVPINVLNDVLIREEKGKKAPKLEVISTNRMPQVITMDSTGNENIIMVPVKARAGYLNGYADPEFITSLPAYRLPGLNHGTYRMFEVEGSSMYPTINGGDVVIGSFVENLMDVRDDRLYVVVTKTDGMVIKRCLNRIQQDGKLILKSDNYKDRDLYPTIIVSPEDVMEIWYAKSYMSYQMRPPSEMYNRLIDLEGRLTLLEHLNKK